MMKGNVEPMHPQALTQIFPSVSSTRPLQIANPGPELLNV